MRFPGGCTWSLEAKGVAIDGVLRASSAAEVRLAARVRADHGPAIEAVLRKVPVPIELVVACVCTESGGRADAVRLEPGCDRADPGRTPGRVSLGLMQTLLSTAREQLGDPALTLDALGDPRTSVEAGARYIRAQAPLTGFDPPLVAAAYNAGGLYENGGSANRWRLRQYPLGTGAHVDRFVGFFDAALTEARVRPFADDVPSYARILAKAQSPFSARNGAAA
jgi:soluble lytic murein transglycosylase-like protein